MKSLKWVLAAMAVSLVAACGGGGGCSGTPAFGTAASGAGVCGSGSGPSPASVDVLASSVQVGTGGDTVTISAVVKDANNVGLAAAPITFSATTGNLTAASAVTDGSGVATATFAAGADRTNRQATVTVRSGSASGQVALDIAGTVLSYSGATTVQFTGKTTLSVKAVDSKGAPISNLPIAVSSSLGNTLSSASINTDALGVATVDYTAAIAGADTLKFTATGSTVSTTLQISSAQFAFLAPTVGQQIPVSTTQILTVQYLSNGAPQANQTINFAATAGVVSPPSAVTNAAGQASVAISSITASPAVVQASVAGVAVQATVPVVFVAQTPAKVVLQVSPTAIGPNPTGTQTSQASLVAIVTDSNGNPASGITVTFNRLADPSGGNLSQASAVTDSSGQATVQYIAGASTTAADGVQVRAAVLGAPTVFGDTQLTVNQSALFIVLGTGNVIGNLDPQTYKKDWVVYVTDSNGVAVPNVNLTISVLPTDYLKGQLIYNGTQWTYDIPNTFVCQNEDQNYNGVLDPGEDFNGDGKLEPGNVIAVTTAQTPTASSSGIAKTGPDGRATITLLYGENYAPWLHVKLVAQARVSGTESSTEQDFLIVGASSDFTDAKNPPAGVVSPFGVNDCATPK